MSANLIRQVTLNITYHRSGQKPLFDNNYAVDMRHLLEKQYGSAEAIPETLWIGFFGSAYEIHWISSTLVGFLNRNQKPTVTCKLSWYNCGGVVPVPCKFENVRGAEVREQSFVSICPPKVSALLIAEPHPLAIAKAGEELFEESDCEDCSFDLTGRSGRSGSTGW